MVHPDRQAARLAAPTLALKLANEAKKPNQMAESMAGVPVEDPAAVASFSAASNTVLNYQN
jgi:hypothetical protein